MSEYNDNVIEFSLALDRMGIKRVHKCDGPCCKVRGVEVHEGPVEHITLEGDSIIPDNYKGPDNAA